MADRTRRVSRDGPGGWLQLTGALALIAAVTLFSGPGGQAHGFRWAIDIDPRHLLEDVLNAVLFAPLGAACRRLGLALASTTLAAAATSTAVEICQLLVINGRYAELQDIFANTAGGIAGWFVARALVRASRSA